MRDVIWIAPIAFALAGSVAQSASNLPTSGANAASPVTRKFRPALMQDRFGDGGTSRFYEIKGPPPRAPGLMIRTESLSGIRLPTSAGQGLRILYSSTNGVGSPLPVAVSGLVLLPKTAMPKGGWPIVAWEHGTTGIADVCAPSWRGYSSRDRTYLNRWLDEGFAVVATDYQGLGTPGPHPYLLYRPEGYSVLDAARAALRHYNGKLRNKIVLVGQSQGSGAAVGAAWLAPRYSPDLHIIGVVVTGLIFKFVTKTGAEHPPMPVNIDDPTGMDPAYAILRVEGTDQSLHPQMDAQDMMTQDGIALSKTARTACDLFIKAKAAKVSGADLFTPAVNQIEAGEKAASLMPDAKIVVPVFAGTGLADTEVSLPGQYNAVAAMCDAGTVVVWRRYPGLTHNGTVNGSLVDSIPFVQDLMSGRPEQGNCRSLSTPGPVEPANPTVLFND